ncbi:uncharacterized protein LOC118768153 [Octopus sinensis]|uniref:Uncharacterized protein LOC118768153 n=1 Tax=Octopus sinensis TaxID=2607531 RepID=A0A7E6FQV4_9MOLL|nr:uncharacterized protein LOC118768153 [Octopus sinensis]
MPGFVLEILHDRSMSTTSENAEVAGPVVLGGNVLLRTEEVPNMKRPIAWENGRCYNGHYEVSPTGNISTLWIQSPSKCTKYFQYSENKSTATNYSPYGKHSE